MPRVSKRKKAETVHEKSRYYRTYLYVRLSEKDGGHGRRDSIYIQKQICMDYAKKHPELLIMKTCVDNGVTGTNFERAGFEQLMVAVRSGKVDCIVVKDFSRFGRDALDAVDLIDTIFPSLNVRFISVLDEYDSENPVCVQDRVNNILKHFMNDYYAREVSGKLVQAHKISREKGEFWGGRPPYGFERSIENSKMLVPEPAEREYVQKIFYWYVFDDMSAYDIVKELNTMQVPSPAESYELRHYGKTKRKKKVYWNAQYIRTMLQNPVYIGANAYGKTKRMLAENIPLHLVPRDQWEIKYNMWEPLVEGSVFDEAQKIGMERWKDNLKQWAINDNQGKSADGPLLSHIYCGTCGKKLQRTMNNYRYLSYFCVTPRNVKEAKCTKTVSERYVMDAVSAALKYQIRLAADFERKYGMEFYTTLEMETEHRIKKARQKYEKYGVKLEQLFEHYATGILDKEEYLEIKNTYQIEQSETYDALIALQKHYQGLLDRLKAKMDWAEQLIQYQGFTEVSRQMVESCIEKVIVRSTSEIIVNFWFGDIFEEEIPNMEGGLSYAV